MKLTLLRILSLCLLTGCETTLDCNAGKYRTMGDNTMVKITAVNGKITSYEAVTNNHSAVTRANWQGFGAVAGQAASFAAGPATGAAVSMGSAFLNRQTSRPASEQTLFHQGQVIRPITR